MAIFLLVQDGTTVDSNRSDLADTSTSASRTLAALLTCLRHTKQFPIPCSNCYRETGEELFDVQYGDRLEEPCSTRITLAIGNDNTATIAVVQEISNQSALGAAFVKNGMLSFHMLSGFEVMKGNTSIGNKI